MCLLWFPDCGVWLSVGACLWGHMDTFDMREKERESGKKETVGEFRWIWCGDGGGKKGNWKREAWVWFWGFSKWGTTDGWVSPQHVRVCIFVFVEANRHKHIWVHCPAPSLCLVYKARRTTQDLCLMRRSMWQRWYYWSCQKMSNPSAYLSADLI